jgi:hypothetical protein
MPDTKEKVVCAYCGRTINLASSRLMYGGGSTGRICGIARPTAAGNQKCDEITAGRRGMSMAQYHIWRYGF